MKKIFWVVIVGVLVVATFVFAPKDADVEEKIVLDARSATFLIVGKEVILGEVAPGSNTITRYFGNELKTDLNDDGREDAVFLVTQETGGSGVFFYVVAALNTEKGYVGSDGFFLGDRVAPQTTELSKNPRHKNVIVVNYADRSPQEPFTTKPSVGKSAYLKLDLERMQWGIVVPDFEGESDF